MTDPAFTETMQIGIVVPDLDAAIRAWEEGFGIGPWRVFTLGPEDCRDVRVHGQPAEWRARAAIAHIGSVMWELIEPQDEDDIFARFLAEHGPASTTSRCARRTTTARWRRSPSGATRWC